jgi:PAS domain S-box-containing protein
VPPAIPSELLDDLGGAVVLVDEADRVVHWSTQAEALLGGSDGERVGRPLAECLRLGGAPLPLAEVRAFLAERGGAWHGEGTFATLTRPALDAEWLVRPLDAASGTLCLVIRARPVQAPGADDEESRTAWTRFDRSVSELITLPPEADFFAAAAQRILEVCSARFVTLSEVAGEVLVCRAFASRTLLVDAARVLGVEPVGLELPLSERARTELATGRLHAVPGGLYAILLGRFPEWLCRLVARSAGLGPIYSIGLCWQGELHGNVTFALPDRAPVPVERIEALANLVALAYQKRQTESALRRSEERYRTLFQSSALAIGVRDLEGNYVEFNQAYARMLGYSLDELKAKRTLDITHPDDVPVSAGNLAVIGSGKADVRRYLKRYLRKDGAIVWGDVCIQPLRHQDGEPYAVLGTVVDVTERWEAQRESEAWKQRYELIALSSGNIVYDCALSGTIAWGGSHDSVLGYTREELAGGYPQWLELIHPEDRDSTHARFEEAARAGSRFEAEYRFRHKDGHYVLLRDTGYPVQLKDGKVDRFIGAMVDITAERQAEERRRALEEQLRQAQKMESIGRLAGGVAHDFNNIMTGIMGYTELLLADPPSQAAREDLLEIKHAAKRAAALTSQLLAFSRRQIIVPRVLDLRELLAGSARMLQRLIGEDVTLTLRVDAELPPIVADPSQIDQVLFNLAVNARDAMPGGGTLTVAASTETVDDARAARAAGARPGRYVEIAVSDTGHGMSPEVLERLFEPFFTTKEQGKGTGLGLSTVFGILQQNGGFVEVESAPGEGACFRLFWPRATEVAAEAPGHEVQPQPRPGHETVLVVEDEESVRALVRRFLVQSGYQVLSAATAAEAEAALLAAEPRVAILLTDVIMPESDGRQLHERLRALQPGLKVVYMSGYPGEVIARHGVLEGSVHFVQKPFTAHALTSALREALDGER